MRVTPFHLLTLVLASVSATVDVIGYYGNSGNAVGSIPLIADVNENYNVIIITFASVDDDGAVALDIQGPYEDDLDSLAKDLLTWKGQPDLYGRERLAMVSVGGQNGRWPSDLSSDALLAGLLDFFGEYNLDGLDIDLEGSAVSAASTLTTVISSLTSSGYTVTAAPEAAQGPLDAYTDILPLLTWVHPQFYNNGPNAITTPYVPSADLWPTPWTVTDWQDEVDGGYAFWAGSLDAISDADGLTEDQKGMLIPCSTSAASSYNNWDIAKLAKEVVYANVTHVGTWAIAYDNEQGYTFAETMGALN
jgi:chitinase